jgi:hypothetical protein
VAEDLDKDLLSEIAAVAKNAKETRHKQCGIKQLLADLPEAQANTIRTCLDDPIIHGTVIAKTLKNRGITVNGSYIQSSTVQRHRAGKCSCDG